MARHKARCDRSDTPKRKTELLSMMREGVAPPAGCAFANDEERTLWGVYTQARVPDDWRETDLPSLYKFVKMEVQIRVGNRLLEAEAAVLKGGAGRTIKTAPSCPAIPTDASVAIATRPQNPRSC